jgi:mannose-6-phosphate isomerase-like protein (cupin superfamily)
MSYKCKVNNYVNGTSDVRPWGSWRVICVGEGYVVKEIVVNPGAILSLQRHQHRSEHWTVVSGVATVTRDEEIIEVQANEHICLPSKCWHRAENRTNETLIFIEVQMGDILDESDIERKDDKYGRAT